ncbi:MAG: hypothetical protein R3C04_10030 [Hyphomonas sp.]
MIEGSCHCGKVQWTFEGDAGSVTACNCTLCRRYGVLWAYDYQNQRIRLTGETASYVRADQKDPQLEILFCPACAGVAAWRALQADGRECASRPAGNRGGSAGRSFRRA